MIHYGDITKIKGYGVPTPDCVIGGSPCQDLSGAGKRAGLDGERSGLFMEQIRIIKELRDKDVRNGRTGEFVRPRFMVWENVPGAFSSNKGEDFRIVLEETAKVVDKDASIPMPPKDKWTTSGCIMGDGWSIAWRILDAQFWGVPQRRRRIALVADFGGQCAPEILFERKGLRGDSAESGKERKATSSDAQRSIAADDREGAICYGIGVYNQAITGDKTKTSNSAASDADHVPCAVYSIENHPNDSRVKIDDEGKVQALTSCMGTGGGNVPMVMSAYQDKVGTLCARDHKGVGSQYVDEDKLIVAYGINGDKAGTLDASYYKGCGERSGVERDVVFMSAKPHYIVRRLTPLECERLQGFPDLWTDIGEYIDSSGKKKQTSDSARYKALGNSIALPSWKWVLKRLCSHYERDATMASLFDGIGGFPYLWEQINGKGSCLWASEIEDFPIAVTKARIN